MGAARSVPRAGAKEREQRGREATGRKDGIPRRRVRPLGAASTGALATDSPIQTTKEGSAAMRRFLLFISFNEASSNIGVLSLSLVSSICPPRVPHRAMAAAAAVTTGAASSSLLRLSLLRFPNRLLSSSSLRLPSFHLLASVPVSVSHCHHPLSPIAPLPSFHRAKKALAVDGAEENAAVTTVVDEKLEDGADDGVPEEVNAPVRRPCELYVCNLPRSCDISKLLDLFKPYGTVHSVEVLALNFVYWFPSRFSPFLSSISFCCLRRE
ncbi:hypothetical protein B296_00014056 [Ensete ventricosum]|uniref:RRM domain-containing protein n=1 Tax=Ensete ventricosum TaxID=4639 RepID=A0A426ZQZ3_ENSVE|nr:hypothetical protein B296_00014056 [Ensete ventricosum]